jgi:hypothetical protein
MSNVSDVVNRFATAKNFRAYRLAKRAMARLDRYGQIVAVDAAIDARARLEGRVYRGREDRRAWFVDFARAGEVLDTAGPFGDQIEAVECARRGADAVGA